MIPEKISTIAKSFIEFSVGRRIDLVRSHRFKEMSFR